MMTTTKKTSTKRIVKQRSDWNRRIRGIRKRVSFRLGLLGLCGLSTCEMGLFENEAK